ncbi:two-component sensor histidine kinase [Kitasatospora herbaricolor]|uniref:HAMP domain-containing sensor histidine kinase n=1 Tax=Kitasatospora herbaricolor TaxID=68217 RepID=UPI0017483B43|nr:HAMP domain-containing sensor histidine kinase [Kitasatospora herbaricolor]MDQ0306838.1 signal transduction histidine kinase [Kitasatospora herbaricolor]GGV51289.1 two-component sensor histidine kinase [Kitasatospora herbaricolor]
MRRCLAGAALAVTSVVVLSFLLPLSVLVVRQARAQSIAAAEDRAAALTPVLALTTSVSDLGRAVSALHHADTLGVHLPDGQTAGATRSPAALVRHASEAREFVARDLPGGRLYLQPVTLPHGGVAVVEAFVPCAEQRRGVVFPITVMVLLAVGLVGGSVLLADRLGAQVVRSSRSLSRASRALGAGDLGYRVDATGPLELQAAGQAFNAMADRVVELLATERELVAHLSHRLRTPLTALQLAVDKSASTAGAERITAAVGRLEHELDSIIMTARAPLATGAAGRAFAGTTFSGASAGHHAEGRPVPATHLGGVVRGRAGFWAVLAQMDGRRCSAEITAEATPVELGAEELVAVVDALVGNVFRHTPPGTPYAITVRRVGRSVELVVEDAGPGMPGAAGPGHRGAGLGSTGLGLDIVARAAQATGGRLDIARGAPGGTRVTLTLGFRTDREPGTGVRWRSSDRHGPPSP